jgi:Fic family protein
MTLFSTGGARITNDDVQRLVNVSDATATRYLDELEQEKQITQVGREGKYVYYEKR